MIRSVFRILELTIIGIILLIGGIVGFYFVKNYISDQSTLKQIPEKVSWIENFYTTNAHYPTSQEFNNQFPDFHKISKRGYGAYGETPQDFDLSYDLSKERAEAIGTPAHTLFYDGYYDVRSCSRWTSLGLEPAANDVYVAPPGELLFSDLKTGEVYLAKVDNNGTQKDKISLLNGLNKPRIFQKSSGGKTVNIILTNGNDVISYDWDGVNLKLNNPQKIGQVPTGCPASSSR